MVKDTTLYDRLGLAPDASESQIKKAFIQLSKQWHPDKHTDEMKEEASTKFKSITEAKDILSDTEKRNTYDQIGMDIFKQNSGQASENPFGGFPFGNPFGGFPFGNPFGGNPFGGNPFGNQGPVRQLHPVQITASVTLEQIYRQETINISYTYQKDCEKCNGEGGKTDSCNVCKGNGKIVQVQKMGNMMTQSIRDCHGCSGKGKTVSSNCKSCNGNCAVDEQKMVSFPLSSQLVSGNKIQVKNEGNRSKQHASDLIVTINILPHSVFKQDNANLYVKIELSLYEALFGFTKMIKYIDGNDMTFESTEKTNYYTVKCIPNKGVNTQGNLYVIYTFGLPTLDKGCKDVLRDLISNKVENYEQNKDNVMTFLKL